MKHLRPYLFPLVCILAGLIFAGFGGYNLYARFTFTPTDALITDVWYTDSGNYEDAPSTHALVSYTVDGESYEEELQNFATKDAEIGKVIRVRYNPNNPSEVHGDKTILPYVQVAFGSLFVVVGAVLLTRVKNERNRRSGDFESSFGTLNQ